MKRVIKVFYYQDLRLMEVPFAAVPIVLRWLRHERVVVVGGGCERGGVNARYAAHTWRYIAGA